MKVQWTKDRDIREAVTRKWDGILSSSIEESTLFPLQIKLTMPPKELWPSCWDEIIDWVEQLYHRGENGQIYRVITKHFRHPTLGKNELPTHVVFEEAEQACQYLGRLSEYHRFVQTTTMLTTPWPQLRMWAGKYPQKIFQLETQFRPYLNVLQWFATHQPERQYLRELRIPGVDTKFIEKNKAIIGELLDYILPENRINSDEKDFEHRYLLAKKAVMVRFRILDERQRLNNLSDLTVPVNEFAQCHLPQRIFFIVENEMSFLTFPSVPDACVIFGKGYGVDMLGNALWLQSKTLYYWGDLDTHGFQILSNIRGLFPHVTSLLMEEAVLLAHKPYWATEDDPSLHSPSHLTNEEYDLCCRLQSNHWGNHIRLEQERIEKSLLLEQLETLLNT